MNISKELLSEVVGKEVKEIRWVKEHKSQMQYDVEADMDYTTINIYELAHKCKEWANKYQHEAEVVDKQVKLLSYTDRFGGHCRIKLFPAQPDCTDVSFSEPTEPEAIFKACEWILQQKATK